MAKRNIVAAINWDMILHPRFEPRAVIEVVSFDDPGKLVDLFDGEAEVGGGGHQGHRQSQDDPVGRQKPLRPASKIGARGKGALVSNVGAQQDHAT